LQPPRRRRITQATAPPAFRRKNLRRHASAFLLLFFLHTPVCRLASEQTKRFAKFFEQLSEGVAHLSGLRNAERQYRNAEALLTAELEMNVSIFESNCVLTALYLLAC
jgi:hypothetical protein